MKQEIAPKDSPRGQAFELWKTVGMPKVMIFKTLNVGRLVVAGRRNDMKFNMLMCWCIGRAALNIREFYTLPAGGRLWQYDRLAVKVVEDLGRSAALRHPVCRQSAAVQCRLSTADPTRPRH